MTSIGQIKNGTSAATTRTTVSWISIVALIAINSYRAATQGFVGDEALTYFWFLQGPWSSIFTRYDANNHVLFTILAKLSITLFGLSEIALRVPSLIGGGLYLIAAHRLSGLLSRTQAGYFLSFSLLSLNPLVLDFLSCGRGYSLGLAGLFWGLLESVRWLARQEPRLLKMGIWLAVAVCANLTMLTPSVSLLAVTAAFAWREKRGARELWVAALVFVCICSSLLAAPLSHATRGHFYAGTNTVADSFRSLIDTYVPPVAVSVWAWAAAAMLLFIVLAVVRNSRDPKSATAAVLILSLVALFVAHCVYEVPLPLNRTGLYLIPLFSLASVVAWEMLPRNMTGRLFRVAIGTLLLGALFFYVRGFRKDHYAVWWYDSATKMAVKQIVEWTRTQKKASTAVVAATIWVYPPLALYAKMSNGKFVATPVMEGCKETSITFDIPAVSNFESATAAGRGSALPQPDLYFLHNPDLPYLQLCGLRKIAEYPSAMSVLAVKD